MYTIRQRIGPLFMKMQKRFGNLDYAGELSEKDIIRAERNSGFISDRVREIQRQNYQRKMETKESREKDLREGLQLYKSGKYEEAREKFESVLGSRPTPNEASVASYNVSCCYSKLNQAITSTGTKKGELFLADVSTKLTNKNITTDVKVDTNSNIALLSMNILFYIIGIYCNLIPTSLLFPSSAPSVELQYLHEYAGISTSLGLTANPIVNFSGVFGNSTLALGTDLSFDTASGNFTKCNAGLSFTNDDLIASVNV
ncbi:mitochondrial outer membrane protein porin of 36 kDa-like [Spinacia oleracea]|uniref:Mitochondrial outer membrane protein porin of 36 kDa-like n=1 Tax=Spinacia oleracea TaxID=3562 RepID=A0ABM3RJ84_SPIOL|nr:mitochondrial outer membrane protein porin of 36 kDa-like [Spinacia oleracea]